MAHTMKVECPRCMSGDCNATYEELGVLIRLPLQKATVFCRGCGYMKVGLLANRKELVVETREPGGDDTEIEYVYLGRMPG